jgi:hypothetical protein
MISQYFKRLQIVIGMLMVHIVVSSPAIAAPEVTTLAAKDITQNSATLVALVEATAPIMSIQFEYGTSTSYGTTERLAQRGPDRKRRNVSLRATGLDCGTSYHFRAVLTVRRTTYEGGDIEFSTLPCAQSAPSQPPASTLPEIETNAATNIGLSYGRMWATVNPNGSETNVWFEFGTSTSYGKKVDVPGSSRGSNPTNLSAIVSGLGCGTTYHFRAAANNDAGFLRGDDVTFDTLDCPPPPISEPDVTTVVACKRYYAICCYPECSGNQWIAEIFLAGIL